MPLILRCDAPDCGKETSATLTGSGRLLPMQDGWWYARRDEDTICACCDAHLAFASGYKPPSSDEAAQED
jgi:hypothetical protein